MPFWEAPSGSLGPLNGNDAVPSYAKICRGHSGEERGVPILASSADRQVLEVKASCSERAHREDLGHAELESNTVWEPPVKCITYVLANCGTHPFKKNHNPSISLGGLA